MRSRILVLFVILVSCLLFSTNVDAQTVAAGIVNSSGSTLSIMAESSTNITTGGLSNFVVTVRWLTSYGVTLGNLVDGTMTTGQAFGTASQGTYTGGSYTYETFAAVPGAGSITWTSGTPYLLFKVDVSGGVGTGTFELITDATTSAQNGDWYFEIGGSDHTNPTFYQSSVGTVPLPVELTNCVAVANRLNTTINWTTATETNNFGFDVERKLASGSDWAKVGFVAGKGTSTSPTLYSYADQGVAPGLYNYRLKQIDKTGSFKYSTVMTVDVGAAAKVFTLSDNYPNPFNPSTNIEFTLPSDGHVTLKVYNIIGQEVATLFDGEGLAGRYIEAKFDATRLASGVYFARLESGGKSLMKKMLLLK